VLYLVKDLSLLGYGQVHCLPPFAAGFLGG